MKPLFFIVLFLANGLCFSQEKTNYETVSRQLLQNIISKKSYDKQLKILQESTLNSLVEELKTDEQKIAFWVNIYNAFIQISLTEAPELYKNKGKFFSTKRILIAGELLSFDDLEHGIIRKSRMKLSLGYLRKWFRPKWERKLRVKKIDWRVHFALNCGAKSCPPVAIYSSEKLNSELDFMTREYLKEQTIYSSDTEIAKTVALFSWFRGDFGGIKGAKKILKEYKITPEKPRKLNFKTYNWALYLNNFRFLPE